ncbi:unnamed protein product [Caenorhabditis auriculariae]|uniref:Uncharacterized protein n=1 Tax=Caenorhabditis auriculariae TaxID=2777116 RepID=A0A8S1H8F2_9PELO|nr:unnamed protein product [Caenorhabditis auriculariae]
MSKIFTIVLAIIFVESIAGNYRPGDICNLGNRRAKGSYYEECVTKFETAGCYAHWERGARRFVRNTEQRDRHYHDGRVGFRYQCTIANGYIQFSPIGCFLNKEHGNEFLHLNASGILDDGQRVRCKQNAEGAFSFEFAERRYG